MLQKADISFKAQYLQTALGPMTILKSPAGISIKEAINYQNKPIIACNCYYSENDRYSYQVIYVVLEPDLQNPTYYLESDGTLPEFFINPEGKLYTAIEVYHPDKDGLIIMVPCFDRDNITYPKPKKMTLGDYIGIYHDFAIFKNVDIFSDKQLDKLIAVEFKHGELKKSYTAKIPFPKYNQFFINNDNKQIHIIAKSEENCWLHRQIDEKGAVLQSRRIDIACNDYPNCVLNLSFCESSYVVTHGEGGIFYLITLTPQGEATRNKLFDVGSPLFWVWDPVKIATETFVIRFTIETGNGWITLRNNKVIEAFLQQQPGKFTNLLTNEIIILAEENLIISDLISCQNNSYTLVFYDYQEDRTKRNTTLFVLNRTLV